MVILAVSCISLIAVAGLALDGGRAYAERREMQNSADSAAMAATRQLDEFLVGNTADASTIDDAARDAAEKNGAVRSTVTCDLVRFDRSVIEPCPLVATMQPAVKAVAAGVVVGTSNTEETFFMKVMGTSTFTATAAATAQIGRAGGAFLAPFMICATAAVLDEDGDFNTTADDFRLLIPDPTPLTTGDETDHAVEGFYINPNAVGHEYDIYGNDIKDGKDCGGGSSFRGRVCQNKNKCTDDGVSYPTPGFWDPDTGNATGPTMRLVNAGDICEETLTENCVLAIPLCPRTNGDTGPAVKLYCTEFGLFELTTIQNHDIDGIFRGRATFNRGGIVGPADANGSHIVALTE